VGAFRREYGKGVGQFYTKVGFFAGDLQGSMRHQVIWLAPLAAIDSILVVRVRNTAFYTKVYWGLVAGNGRRGQSAPD
jgi:hypothetical protein